MPFLRRIVVLLLVFPPSLAAQTWNGPEVRTLVERAIARRATVQADSGLKAYRARAHGFVFFLGQLGEGFSEPPRLIKSDQLELEVYWRAPGLSKQIIIGRRDRRDLPTDIAYHRDHLGIVQNNFGDSIRLGDGDEAKDVPHPLSPSGAALYDFALTDSLAIELPDRTVRVYVVQFRPREFGAPRIAGLVYLDVERAEPVRFQFSFTPAAYRDPSLEDVTVALDNGLWFGEYWLPRRQEIEIRRRTSWLDLPARGIIRGRWEIGGYEFNPELPPGLFQPGAPEIISAPPARRDSFAWEATLDAEIRRAAGPVEAADLETVRTTIERAVENRAMTGLPRSSPRFGGVSDILHVNRVRGLTPGAGWRVRMGERGVVIGVGAAYGMADRRVTGHAGLSAPVGAWSLSLRGAREIRDIGDEPVIAPVLNSLAAQELGVDYGDYVLVHRALVTLRRPVGTRGEFQVDAGVEEPRSVATAARSASGQYRDNPSLGSLARSVGRLSFTRAVESFGARVRAGGRASIEGGVSSGSRYVRARVHAELAVDAGPTRLVVATQAGIGSRGLPRDLGFVLGGRGTLPGDQYRAWGGGRAILGRLEWNITVPFVALPLGAFGSTGRTAVFAPFVAAGWADQPVPGGVGIATPGVRTSAGVALELLHRMLRLEVSTSLHGGPAVFSVDIRRDLWPVL